MNAKFLHTFFMLLITILLWYRLALLSEILDGSDIMGTVDLLKLREIASSGRYFSH